MTAAASSSWATRACSCGTYGENPRIVPRSGCRSSRRPEKTDPALAGHREEWFEPSRRRTSRRRLLLLGPAAETMLLANVASACEKNMKLLWDAEKMGSPTSPNNELLHFLYRPLEPVKPDRERVNDERTVPARGRPFFLWRPDELQDTDHDPDEALSSLGRRRRQIACPSTTRTVPAAGRGAGPAAPARPPAPTGRSLRRPGLAPGPTQGPAGSVEGRDG